MTTLNELKKGDRCVAVRHSKEGVSLELVEVVSTSKKLIVIQFEHATPSQARREFYRESGQQRFDLQKGTNIALYPSAEAYLEEQRHLVEGFLEAEENQRDDGLSEEQVDQIHTYLEALINTPKADRDYNGINLTLVSQDWEPEDALTAFEEGTLSEDELDDLLMVASDYCHYYV